MAGEPRTRRQAGPSRVPDGQPAADPEAVHRCVLRHLRAPFQRPNDTPGVARIRAQLAAMELPEGRGEHGEDHTFWNGWLVDAGCGDASSARRRAAEQPGLKVLAIDKSSERLQRGQRRFDGDGPTAGVHYLQADVVDFFVLAASEGWVFPKLLLCHPNPWPKARHRGRRWYGHPVWPLMLSSTHAIEVRSNWPIYSEELAIALRLATGVQPNLRTLTPDEPALSSFEHKYRESGHEIHICELASDQALIRH